MEDIIYRRRIALSNFPIKGYFRFKDVFQILPPDNDAPKPPALDGHHPVILEYRFDPPSLEQDRQIPAPDWVIIN